MRCHTAIKTLIAYTGIVSINSYTHCSQELQEFHNKQSRTMHVINEIIHEDKNKDIVIIEKDPIKATLRQIIASAKEGELNWRGFI